ncbi:hypothetical protein BHE90_014284 [Fusarium euwallaceae]|uniref:HNH nuclease domain-containing protein n=1 Tax=Fusarium euwallaceae TaxID=1147111 RepID=A0A430L6I6_9HYPO|nr:hypothetical protein BHE90_014284 [Fusarium euwallaceae]
MCSTAVTPAGRTLGWNIHFLAGRGRGHFAGLFHPSDSDLVTFRDVVDELRLCFEFPDSTSNSGAWDQIAFGLIDSPSPMNSCPALFSEEGLDLPVPSVSTPDIRRPNVLSFRIVHHAPCNLPSNSSLNKHLEGLFKQSTVPPAQNANATVARCAQHVPQPVRRHERRYLPPKKPSPDPRYAIMPLRKTLKGKSRSASPPKHTMSGSVSPARDGAADADEEDITGMVAPPNMTLALDYARSTAAKFRSSCLQASNVCAVSGKGQSWYFTPAVGPALQACHIVKQQHYHLYPDHELEDDACLEDSSRRLQQLWHSTWSASNGILLLTHLHDLFDARLFSIHPDTHRIRAFVPYDVLTEFHGRKAILPPIVDREALRHHYEMCCIENMAALTPYPETISLGIATSGTSTALSSRTNFPITPTPGDVVVGEPSKRSRSTRHDQGQAPKGNDVEEGLEDEGGGKRRRLDDSKTYDEGIHDWATNRIFDTHMTPLNSRQFLADVNWELHKLKTEDSA